MKIWHQTAFHFSWYTILPCKITHVHAEAMIWFTLWCWCCFFLIVSGFSFSVTSMKDLLLYQCHCSWIVSWFKMSFKHCAEVRLNGKLEVCSWCWGRSQAWSYENQLDWRRKLSSSSCGRSQKSPLVTNQECFSFCLAKFLVPELKMLSDFVSFL